MPGIQEDPNCADSIKVPDNILDHLTYLGISTGCEANSEIQGEVEHVEQVQQQLINEQFKPVEESQKFLPQV